MKKPFAVGIAASAVFCVAFVGVQLAGLQDVNGQEQEHTPMQTLPQTQEQEQGQEQQRLFLIPPYVFSIKGQHIGLAWRYLEPQVETKAKTDTNTSTDTNTDTNSNTDDTLSMLTRSSVVASTEAQTEASTMTLPAAQSEVSFFWQGREIPLTVQNHNGLQMTVLPLPMCGFGNDATYFIKGMKQPQKILDVPCAGSLGTTHFTIVADTQGNALASNQKFVKLIAQSPSTALVVSGDLTDAGTSAKLWVRFFNALAPIIGSHMLIPVVGNHEYHHNPEVPAWPYFFDTKAHEAYYSLNLGDVHLIVLNSCFFDDPSLIGLQLPWLESELQKPARWKIVTFHHAPYSRSVMNNIHYFKKEFLSLQKYYVPLFEKYKVDLVVTGHVHFYEHSIKNGVHYLVTGPAGGALGFVGSKNPYAVKFARTRTMIQIDANAMALRASVINIHNQLVDEVVLGEGASGVRRAPVLNPASTK